MPEHPLDHDILIRVEEQMKNLTAKVEVLTDDHEARLRYLERWVWKAIGGLVVVDFILAGIVAWITNRTH